MRGEPAGVFFFDRNTNEAIAEGLSEIALDKSPTSGQKDRSRKSH